MNKLISLIILMFLSLPVAAESYFCTSELMASIEYNKDTKKWFANSGVYDYQKYIIRPAKPEDIKDTYLPASAAKMDAINFVVQKHGDDFISEYCSGFNDVGFLECHTDDFMMNNKALRFQSIHPTGYVVSKYDDEDGFMPEGKYVPFIMVGTCSQID